MSNSSTRLSKDVEGSDSLRSIVVFPTIFDSFCSRTRCALDLAGVDMVRRVKTNNV